MNKDTIINGIMISVIVIVVVGIMGYLFWIALESPEHNNNLAEEICSNEINAATGIKRNGQYGLFAYTCGLKGGEDYILYINSSSSRFSPMKFTANKDYHIQGIGFDKYSPEQNWYLYLYSVSNQSYIAQGYFHFEGGGMIMVFERLLGDLIPLMVLLFIIFGFGIPFEKYILKKRILRRIFDFPERKEEEDSEIIGVNTTVQDSNTLASLEQLPNKSEKKEEKEIEFAITSIKNNKCPECESIEIGYNFSKKQFNCNECNWKS